MKILTETKNGFAVEFNAVEFSELMRLVLSVEGKTLDQTYSSQWTIDRSSVYNEHDLTSIFGAIQAFYMEKFRINEIRQGLEILENSLRGKTT